MSNLKIFIVNFTIIIPILLILNISYFKELNNLFVDKLHGNIDVHDDIVILEIDDASLGEISAWPWSRDIYAEVLKNLRKAQVKVVAIDVLLIEDREGDDELDSEIEDLDYELILANKFVDSELLESKFKKEGVFTAYTNFVPDADGKIRMTTLTKEVNRECFSSFAFLAFQRFLKKDGIEDCTDRIQIREGFTIDNKLMFNYSEEPFKKVSITDVYYDHYNTEDFKGKIVLIGSTTTDLKSNLSDNFVDIFGGTTPGVEIHANVINSLLEGKVQKVLSPFMSFCLISLILSVLFIIYRILKNNVVEAFVFIFSMIVVNIFGVVLFEQGINWPFLQFTILILLHYMFTVAYKYFVEHRENRFVKKAFSQYVNPQLLKSLAKTPAGLELGGEEKVISVLFSDIRGFTTISEQLGAEALVAFTNSYLDKVSEIILDNNGTIDKYIGDAVMAFWNAPLADEEHAINAVQTAVLMDKYSKEFSKENTKYPELKIGIGINTGKMVVGNIGGRRRFDYTLLGDEVNLASRIEGLTKKYKVGILITEATYKDVKVATEGILYRLVDEVIVKGKSKSVRLYQPMEANIINQRIIRLYKEGFEKYQKGDFTRAEELFKRNKNDSCSLVMLKRIIALKCKKTWNGVWKWTEK